MFYGYFYWDNDKQTVLKIVGISQVNNRSKILKSFNLLKTNLPM